MLLKRVHKSPIKHGDGLGSSKQNKIYPDVYDPEVTPNTIDKETRNEIKKGIKNFVRLVKIYGLVSPNSTLKNEAQYVTILFRNRKINDLAYNCASNKISKANLTNPMQFKDDKDILNGRIYNELLPGYKDMFEDNTDGHNFKNIGLQF